MKNFTFQKMTLVISILVFFFQNNLLANSNIDNTAPPCMVGNVNLATQSEVDDWVAQWGGCNKIEGNLVVGKNSTFGDLTDVTDISGLLGLEEVTGLIIIQKTQLTSLSGLNNLHTVGGSFIKIGFNYLLENLDGLQNLTSATTLEIYDNYNLETLTGLDGLTSVSDEFLIERNQHLENILALSNLTDVNYLSISEAGRIKNLAGLEGLSHVETLSIKGNDSLMTLQGLNNLETAGSILFGSSNSAADDGNPLLPNLIGLDNLKYSGGLSFYKTNFTSLVGLESLDSIESVGFYYNDVLASFEGFNNLKNVGFNFLVTQNEALADISALANLKKVKGNINFIRCDALEDLTGLGGLEEVMNFSLNENENLPSLNGLNGNTKFIGLFRIFENNSLTSLSGLTNYTSMERLSINGNEELTDISQLSELVEAEGISIHNNDKLDNLIGLENLTTLTNGISIDGNEILNNINGLQNLQTIGDYLFISNNDSLKNLIGLENITFVPGELKISGNKSLADLNGLNFLETVGGDFNIQENDELKDLRILRKINHIGGNLYISSNPSLTEIRGLNNLNSVGGDVSFLNNDTLLKINGLQNLKSVGDGFYIINNDLIQNIDGVDKLTSIVGYISIYDNLSLATCQVHFICRHLISNNLINIHSNKVGCNDENEILENCGINTFIGKVAIDDNQNCELDQDEFSLQGWKVMATSADFENVTFTNSQGEYVLNVDTGIYTVNVISPSSIWQPCIDDQSYVFMENYDTITVDLVNEGLIDCPIMAVEMNSTPLRECAEATFFVDYCNFGTTVANDAYVDVYINDFLTILDASLPYTLDGLIATFPLGDVAPGSCSDFTINMEVSCDVVLGQTVCATAWIYPDSTCEVPSSSWVGADLFVGSFCGQDDIIFEIKNTGTGDMILPADYIVYRNGSPHEVGEILLLANESIEISFPKDGATYRIEVEQVANHPKITTPGATVEACPDDNNYFATGYALQFPIEDYDQSFDRYCLPITGSYDPNDKQGFPLGYGSNLYIEENTAIDYHIRFQNTGNDTAFLVVILDTLPNTLNPSSIELKGSSHDFTSEISENNIIEFRFENILLPDSTTNEKESNGFVSFKIAQQPDLPFGTEIINSAAIYFDYNEPVITKNSVHQVGYETIIKSDTINLCEGESYEGIIYLETTILADSVDYGLIVNIDQKVINVIPPLQLTIDTIITIGDSYEGIAYQTDTTLQNILVDQYGCDSIVMINIMVNPVGLESIDKNPITVNIFPNPISDLSYFEIKNTSINFGKIKVFNSIGQQIREINIYQNKFVFNKGLLSPGVYFYKIEMDNESILTGQFSIE